MAESAEKPPEKLVDIKNMSLGSSSLERRKPAKFDDNIDETVKLKLVQAFENNKRLIEDVTFIFTNWMKLEYDLMVAFKPNDKSIL